MVHDVGSARVASSTQAGSRPLSRREQSRADLYALLAALLGAPPGPGLRAALAHATGRSEAATPVVAAWHALCRAAARDDEDAIADEFAVLFAGGGTPQVAPCASRYCGGFRMQPLLAALRTDLRDLGCERKPGTGIADDHLASLCAVMRTLIAGATGRAPAPASVQKRFFATHIAPWHGRCLGDLRRAPASAFYACVADLGEAFLAAEQETFALDDDGAGSAPARDEA